MTTQTTQQVQLVEQPSFTITAVGGDAHASALECQAANLHAEAAMIADAVRRMLASGQLVNDNGLIKFKR